MKTSRQRVGHWGEQLAARYLQKQGYILLGQNVRTPHGEIDLIASQPCGKGPCLVFVEVKTRRSGAYGLPEAAITASKRAHLLAAAQAYLQVHPELSGVWRIDVIAVRRVSPEAQPEIVHFENAITGE